MLIFKGDDLLVLSDRFDLERPQDCVRSSEELPASWRELPPWCEIDESHPFPEGEWLGLRTVWQRWGDEAFARVGGAYQYMNWVRNTQFCSRCAAPLTPRGEDRGLECASCGRVHYPQIHPAIIVAVEKEGKLLLGHNARMPGGRYSVLAGFVEPGESLEQTVAREIMEEANVDVQDIRYFGSQSWPFPHSLMLGFTARWRSGEARADGVELDHVGWFAPADFPEIPQSISISRKLIDDFVDRMRKKK